MIDGLGRPKGTSDTRAIEIDPAIEAFKKLQPGPRTQEKVLALAELTDALGKALWKHKAIVSGTLAAITTAAAEITNPLKALEGIITSLKAIANLSHAIRSEPDVKPHLEAFLAGVNDLWVTHRDEQSNIKSKPPPDLYETLDTSRPVSPAAVDLAPSTYPAGDSIPNGARRDPIEYRDPDSSKTGLNLTGGADVAGVPEVQPSVKPDKLALGPHVSTIIDLLSSISSHISGHLFEITFAGGQTVMGSMDVFQAGTWDFRDDFALQVRHNPPPTVHLPEIRIRDVGDSTQVKYIKMSDLEKVKVVGGDEVWNLARSGPLMAYSYPDLTPAQEHLVSKILKGSREIIVADRWVDYKKLYALGEEIARLQAGILADVIAQEPADSTVGHLASRAALAIESLRLLDENPDLSSKTLGEVARQAAGALTQYGDREFHLQPFVYHFATSFNTALDNIKDCLTDDIAQDNNIWATLVRGNCQERAQQLRSLVHHLSLDIAYFRAENPDVETRRSLDKIAEEIKKVVLSPRLSSRRI